MKTFTAPFAQTPHGLQPVCTLVSTYGDDVPTNTQLAATAGNDGALLTKLTALPRATVGATNLLLWISKDNGTTKRLVGSVLMPAISVSTTTAIPLTTFGYTEAAPLRLEAGEKLYVGTSVALPAGIVFYSQWTDF